MHRLAKSRMHACGLLTRLQHAALFCFCAGANSCWEQSRSHVEQCYGQAGCAALNVPAKDEFGV